MRCTALPLTPAVTLPRTLEIFELPDERPLALSIQFGIEPGLPTYFVTHREWSVAPRDGGETEARAEYHVALLLRVLGVPQHAPADEPAELAGRAREVSLIEPPSPLRHREIAIDVARKTLHRTLRRLTDRGSGQLDRSLISSPARQRSRALETVDPLAHRLPELRREAPWSTETGERSVARSP